MFPIVTNGGKYNQIQQILMRKLNQIVNKRRKKKIPKTLLKIWLNEYMPYTSVNAISKSTGACRKSITLALETGEATRIMIDKLTKHFANFQIPA